MSLLQLKSRFDGGDLSAGVLYDHYKAEALSSMVTNEPAKAAVPRKPRS
jgi:hypothetical protein